VKDSTKKIAVGARNQVIRYRELEVALSVARSTKKRVASGSMLPDAKRVRAHEVAFKEL
jgi:hypothetical protein